jgi:hypothetical protein
VTLRPRGGPGALEALDAILQGVDGGALTAPDAIEQRFSIGGTVRFSAGVDRTQGLSEMFGQIAPLA